MVLHGSAEGRRLAQFIEPEGYRRAVHRKPFREAQKIVSLGSPNRQVSQVTLRDGEVHRSRYKAEGRVRVAGDPNGILRRDPYGELCREASHAQPRQR